MNTAIIISAYLLIIIIDLPYFYKEDKKSKLVPVYFFYILSGVIVGILIGKTNPPISPSTVITNILNLFTGSD